MFCGKLLRFRDRAQLPWGIFGACAVNLGSSPWFEPPAAGSLCLSDRIWKKSRGRALWLLGCTGACPPGWTNQPLKAEANGVAKCASPAVFSVMLLKRRP